MLRWVVVAGCVAYMTGFELRRKNEHTKALRQRLEQAVDVKSTVTDPDTTRIALGESPCLRVAQFQLLQMGAASSPAGDNTPIGKVLGTRGTALVIKRAQDSAMERGFVTTRVLAQEQDLKEETLTLTALSGRMENIRFKSEDQAKVSTKNTVLIRTSEILNRRDVEQGLENFKRVLTAKPAPGICTTAITSEVFEL
jgi:hemolysin activation/secretion protein